MSNVRFAWMMNYFEGQYHKDGYVPEICDSEGNVLEQLPRELSSIKADKARKAWAKAHPEFITISMPRGVRL